jgi:RHS repeat-associated protein
VKESYRYSAFGQPTIFNASGVEVASSAVKQPFLFTGARWDEESSLYQMRLRYYDPAAGRFVSRDPLGMWGDAAQRGNGQAYCGHDPVNCVDPMGLNQEAINFMEALVRALQRELTNNSSLSASAKAQLIRSMYLGMVALSVYRGVAVTTQVTTGTGVVGALGTALRLGARVAFPLTLIMLAADAPTDEPYDGSDTLNGHPRLPQDPGRPPGPEENKDDGKNHLALGLSSYGGQSGRLEEFRQTVSTHVRSPRVYTDETWSPLVGDVNESFELGFNFATHQVDRIHFNLTGMGSCVIDWLDAARRGNTPGPQPDHVAEWELWQLLTAEDWYGRALRDKTTFWADGKPIQDPFPTNITPD